MPDVVDAQLRLQFLGRYVMLPSVMASDSVSDPAHHDDPNALPVEALKKPHVPSIYNPAFRATQKQREHERLVSNLLRLKRNMPRPENSLLQLRECYPR
jgi:hypothetical protein